MDKYFQDVPEGFQIERDMPTVCSSCFCIVPIWGQEKHRQWHDFVGVG